MTVLEQLDKVKEIGLYEKMLRSGIISLKIDGYIQMMNFYNERLQVNRKYNDCITRSRFDTAEKFRCSMMTVIRAVTFLTKNC